MEQIYIENEIYKKKNFSEEMLLPGEYDSCDFIDCNFSRGNLGAYTFVETTFENCDFSLSHFQGTSFRDVNFINCKLMGLRFDICDPFLLSFHFKDCTLDFSSFYKLKIKGTRYINCKMRETDFTETNLSNSVFEHCDLNGAMFSNTILLKADLSTAENFSLDPEENIIKGARFSEGNIAGLLGRYKIIIVK
ncbi:MAG: pentapeptide repeat-containing protein [Gillisia sp.]